MKEYIVIFFSNHKAFNTLIIFPFIKMNYIRKEIQAKDMKYYVF